MPQPNADHGVKDDPDEMADMMASKEEKEKGGHEKPAPRAAGTIATRKTETTVTIYLSNHDKFDIDAGSDTNQSRTSYSSSIGGAGVNALRVPPLPESASYRNPFQCPICRTIITVSGITSWKYVPVHLSRLFSPKSLDRTALIFTRNYSTDMFGNSC
jgi:hypothetical protein